VEYGVHLHKRAGGVLPMGTTVLEVDSAQEAVTHSCRGDIQEFTDLINRRLPYFHRQALRRLGNAADAEDAVQDALLSAYAHLNQFKGQAQMSTWLTTIVINSARAIARRRPRHLHTPLDPQDQAEDHHAFAQRLADHRPDPEQTCRRSELVQRLACLSARLTPTLRRAFQLREVDGLSILETAQALGVPRSTAKARAARARAKLKRLAQGRAYGKQELV
jgi:RNA polymerase sigma-70 factor (ECF subfamily)